ncbi:MAG: heavy-metal-associated domain-containing protein [Saprospiraceae bacterium]
MEKFQFKTNINCGNCIRSVTGFINDVEGVKSWNVDTDNPDKILTVEAEGINAEAILEAVEEAGFDAERI